MRKVQPKDGVPPLTWTETFNCDIYGKQKSTIDHWWLAWSEPFSPHAEAPERHVALPDQRDGVNRKADEQQENRPAARLEDIKGGKRAHRARLYHFGPKLFPCAPVSLAGAG